MSGAWPWIWFGLAVFAIAVMVLLGVMLWRKAKALGRQLAAASETFSRLADAVERQADLAPVPANALARSKAEVREEWRHNSYRRRARKAARREAHQLRYTRLADIAGLGSLGHLDLAVASGSSDAAGSPVISGSPVTSASPVDSGSPVSPGSPVTAGPQRSLPAADAPARVASNTTSRSTSEGEA